MALMSENNLTQNDILYMETKSIFVQLIRSMPNIADKRPINLPAIAERAATTKDAMLVRKGIKVKEMLPSSFPSPCPLHRRQETSTRHGSGPLLSSATGRSSVLVERTIPLPRPISRLQSWRAGCKPRASSPKTALLW